MDALAGDTDLDLFIPPGSRVEFLGLATSHGWIRLENPVARFPWVTHLYRLDENLEIYHLHVYFKIVTGESWLKEFVLPFDDLLIEQRVRFDESGVWGLSNEIQAYLFAVRHLLKGGSFFSRILYRRELASYREEWLLCHQDAEVLLDLGPLKLNDYIPGSGLQSDEIQLPEIGTALKFRASLAPFLRVSRYSLPFRRIANLVVRSMNKLVFKKKKVFPECGLILAISGIDGSGKSTMLDEADRLFSRCFTVQRFALGKPQGKFLESMRKLLKGRKSRRARRSIEKTKDINGKPSSLSAVSAVILALLRLRMARKALKCRLKGHLALVDRWPTDSVGIMDGPRLQAERCTTALLRRCADVEYWAYSRMPRADICFFLEAPESVLIARNQDRLKVDKETDEEIRARARHNQQFRPLALKVVSFDNNGPLEQKRKELLLRIWQEMAAG